MSSGQEYFALFLVFLSGLGFSIQGLIQKHLSEIGFHDTFVSVIVRGTVQAGSMAVSLYFDEERRQGRNNYFCGPNDFTAKIVFLRSICGFGSIAFAFLAFDRISLGDASVLVMLGPLVAAILSALVLGEPFLPVEMLATILTLFGSALVAKPPFLFGGGDNEAPGSMVGMQPVNQTVAVPVAVIALGGAHPHAGFNALGVTFGLLASVAAGTSFMLLRLLGVQKNVTINFKNICLVQGLVQVLLSVPALFVAGQHCDLAGYSVTEYLLMLAGGVAGTLSQLVMTIGMQQVKSSIGSAMRMSDVAFSFAFQALFTRDPLDMYSIAGAVLVLSGISVMVVFKQNSQAAAKVGTAVEMTQYAQLNNNFNSGGGDATVMLGHMADAESQRPAHPLYDKVKQKLAQRFQQNYMHLGQSDTGDSEHFDYFDGEDDDEAGSVQSDWSFNGELIGAAAQANNCGRLGGWGGGGRSASATYNPLSDSTVDDYDDNIEGGLSQIQVTEMEEEFYRQREAQRLERARAREEAYRANVARLVDNTSYFNQLVQKHVGDAVSSAGSGLYASASYLHGAPRSSASGMAPAGDAAPVTEEARHLPLVDVSLGGSEPATPLCSAPSSPLHQSAVPAAAPVLAALPPPPPPPVTRADSPLLLFAPSPPASPGALPGALAAVQAPSPAATVVPAPFCAVPSLHPQAPHCMPAPRGVVDCADPTSPPDSDSAGWAAEMEESMAFYSCNNTNDALAALQMSMLQDGSETDEL
jgi:drug/metabolite transporter (DMT)-like permease